MNAKEELADMLDKKVIPEVLCAYILCYNPERAPIILKTGYSQEDFADFMQKLNFEYDAGYGTQNLYGTVWMKDGTWLARSEYDGSEHWEWRRCPDIVAECL